MPGSFQGEKCRDKLMSKFTDAHDTPLAECTLPDGFQYSLTLSHIPLCLLSDGISSGSLKHIVTVKALFCCHVAWAWRGITFVIWQQPVLNAELKHRTLQQNNLILPLDNDEIVTGVTGDVVEMYIEHLPWFSHSLLHGW